MKDYIIFLTLSTSVFFLSCKKEANLRNSPEVTNSSKMTTSAVDKSLVQVTSEGYLHFSSPDAFDKTMEVLCNASEQQLDLWEQELKFTSGYTYFNIKEHEENGTPVEDPDFKNSVYDDAMVLRFTNAKGVVQIGDYLFKLEMDKGYILQMYEQDKKTYFPDFENGTFVSSVMNKLNNTLDIGDGTLWEFIAQTPKGLQPMGLIGNIRDLWGDRSKYVEEGGNASVDQGWRYNVIGSYQNIGIYRSVVIKFKYEKEGNLLPQKTVMNIHTTVGSPLQTWGRVFWKDWSCSIKAPNSNDFPYDGNRRSETKWRMYEGSSKVNGADISLYVNYEDRNDGYFKEAYYFWQKPL